MKLANAILDTPNLAAYWPLGSDEGTTALEVSGAGTPLTGTYTNAVARGPVILPSGEPNQPGDPYGSTLFDGTGDLITVATDSRLNPTGSGLTVMCWAQPLALPAASALMTLWSKYQDANNYYACSIYDSTGGTHFGYLNGGFGANTTSSYTWGPWMVGQTFHVAVAYKTDNTADLYLNGTLCRRISGSASVPTTNTGSFVLGRYNGLQDLNAYLAHAAVFSRALSGTEIKAIYEAGSDRTPAAQQRPDYDNTVRADGPRLLVPFAETDSRNTASVTDVIGGVTFTANGPSSGFNRGVPLAQPVPGTNLNSFMVGRGNTFNTAALATDIPAIQTATYTVELIVYVGDMGNPDWRSFVLADGSPGGTYRRAWLLGFNNENPAKVLWSVGSAGSGGTSWNDVVVSTSHASGQWLHLVGTGGTNPALWINGQFIAQSSPAGGAYAPVANQYRILLGTDYATQMTSRISHFAIYDYLLSERQIRAHAIAFRAGGDLMTNSWEAASRRTINLTSRGSLNFYGQESGIQAFESGWIGERPDAPPNGVVAQAVKRAAVI